MTILAAEKAIFTSSADGELPDNESTEALIQAILEKLTDHRARSLDGVILMWHEKGTNRLNIQGVAITIDDQCGHPIELSLVVDPILGISDGSRICFGSTNLASPYNSPESNRLINKVLSSFPASINWRSTFTRNRSDWMLSPA